MRKKTFHTWIIIGCIITVLFNVCFFLVTADDTTVGRSITTWVSYGYIHIALVFLVIAPLFVTKGKSSGDTAMSVFGVCATYWLIELIIGITFILLTSPSAVETFVKPLLNTLSGSIGTKFLYNWIFEILHSDPNKFGIISQTVFLGFFIIVLILLSIINYDTERKEVRHDMEIQFIKTAENQLKLKLFEINDKETAKKIEYLYDFIRTSPLKSTSEIKPIESQILECISNISKSKDNGKICQFAEDALHLAQIRNNELNLKNKEL